MTRDTYNDGPGDEAPRTLGGYTLLRVLGTGGMGTVYEAEQTALKRTVALKVLNPHLSANTEAIQRFIREGEAAGRQQHPHIVAIHDVGQENGVHYIAQELVEGGRSLKEWLEELRQAQTLSNDHYHKLARFFIQIAHALQHAHDGGVIHRDLKPANLLIAPNGHPKVNDFGLALVEDALALSRTGQLAGTPYYMSPEQAASQRVGIDHRTDVFSLGVTLYEALTLTLAFTGDTSQQVIEKILLEDPVHPRKIRSRVPPELAAICLKAVEKNREHRYLTMAAFAEDLQRFLDDEPVLAKPPGLTRRARKWMRRHPVWTASGVVAVVAFCVITVLLGQLWQALETSESRQTVAEAAMWDAVGQTMSLTGRPDAALAAARTGPPPGASPERYHQQLASHLGMATSQVLMGHQDDVYAVAITPDGKRLATTSADTTVRVWDLETGQNLHTLQGHQDPIFSIAITPDGGKVVTGSRLTARVWDLQTGEALHVLEGHEWVIYSIAITPDGERVVTGSLDGRVRIWALDTGTLLKEIWLGNPARRITLTPDGSKLITAERLMRGERVEEDRYGVRIWDMETYDMLEVLEGPLHLDKIEAVAFTPDGLTMVTGSHDHTARVWDLNTGALSAVLTGHQDGAAALAITPDGTRLITGSYDHTARVWDLQTGASLHELQGHEGPVISVALTPDGTQIITGSSDHTARVWDLNTGALMGVFEGHQDTIVSLAIAPDGERLVTGSWDHTARVWGLQSSTGKVLGTHQEDVLATAITPDGTKLVTTSRDHAARVWDLETGATLQVLEEPSAVVSSIAITPDGGRLFTGSQSGRLTGWDVETGQLLYSSDRHSFSALAMARDGIFGAMGHRTGRIAVWNHHEDTTRWSIQGHPLRVDAIAITPDAARLVTAAADKTVKVWDMKTGVFLNELQGVEDSIYAMAFDPEGTLLVTGSRDHTVRIWDFEEGSTLQELEGHTDVIYSVAIEPESGRIFTGSSDNTVRIWDLATGAPIHVIHVHDFGGSATAITPDGMRLVTGSSDGHIRIWDVDPARHPARTLPELIEHVGTYTNYRACRDTHEIVAVIPFPEPASIWAPEALCGQKEPHAKEGTSHP